MPDFAKEIFFETAEAARRQDGTIVIVLETMSKARGGKPEPVRILSCREAGALMLMEVLARALGGA